MSYQTGVELAEARAEIIRLRSEVSAQTAIAHEAQAALREARRELAHTTMQLKMLTDADWDKVMDARLLAEARLAAVARMARNLWANGNRVLAEDLMRTIEEQT